TVLVEHVADLDPAVQLVVGLVPEPEDEAGLEERVPLAGAVVAGGDLAGAAEQRDGPVAFLGDRGESGESRHDDEPERERSHAVPSCGFTASARCWGAGAPGTPRAPAATSDPRRCRRGSQGRRRAGWRHEGGRWPRARRRAVPAR